MKMRLAWLLTHFSGPVRVRLVSHHYDHFWRCWVVKCVVREDRGAYHKDDVTYERETELYANHKWARSGLDSLYSGIPEGIDTLPTGEPLTIEYR